MLGIRSLNCWALVYMHQVFILRYENSTIETDDRKGNYILLRVPDPRKVPDSESEPFIASSMSKVLSMCFSQQPQYHRNSSRQDRTIHPTNGVEAAHKWIQLSPLREMMCLPLSPIIFRTFPSIHLFQWHCSNDPATSKPPTRSMHKW